MALKTKVISDQGMYCSSTVDDIDIKNAREFSIHELL